MRISVIGAGAIGSAVAFDLASRDEVTEIRVCDARSRSLQSLRKLVPSPKMHPYQVDGRDTTVLGTVVEGSDCIVGCADPSINLMLAELCLDIGCNFCDQGGNDEISARILRLDLQAREKGLWLVPNCGLAPGLVNVVALLAIEQFDEVENARIRVGDLPKDPDPPFNFRVPTSAQKLIEDYTSPAYLIRAGEVKQVAPLTEVERIVFDEPYATLEAFCSSANLQALTDHLAGQIQNLDLKTIKWPGHADQWRFLLGLGFGEKKIIDVRTHLTYRDVLARRLRQLLGDEKPDIVLMRVLVNGLKDGEKQTLVYEMMDTFHLENGLSAIRRCTSLPTTTVAMTLARGSRASGGASPPELVLDKNLFLQQLRERGLEINHSWHQGWLDVSDPKANELLQS